jgi:hypothetical protein
MNKISEITEAFPTELFVKADGYDDAIIGVDYCSRCLIYSMNKMIDITIEQMKSPDVPADDDTDFYTMAVEYLEFNTWNAYMGEKTPIWCDDTIFQN